MFCLIVGLKDIGILSIPENVCNVDPNADLRMTASLNKYRTLTGNAARLVWKEWTIPNPPPTGAVAISEKPTRFIATNMNSTVVGYLDPSSGLGKVVFPHEPQPHTSALILAEIEPERYELYDVQFKRDKDFEETEVILSQGVLKYELEDYDDEDGHHRKGYDTESEYESEPSAASSRSPTKGKIESVVSYETEEYDYWGAGHLMAKNLHTFIHLPNGWEPKTKTIEWGLSFVRTGEYLFIKIDL